MKPIEHVLAVHTNYVERLRAITDPWELLTTLEFDHVLDHGVGAHAFAQKRFYPRFIELVARELPAADVDALLASAKVVFGVNIRTMRADLRIARSRVAEVSCA